MIVMLTQSVLRSLGSRLIPEGSDFNVSSGRSCYLKAGAVKFEESE